MQNKSEAVPATQQTTIASFVINEKIYHGPFYWGKDANGQTHFGFGRGYFVSMVTPDDKTNTWLHNQGFTIGDNYLANRTADVSLLGRLRGTSHISPLIYQNGDTHLSWQGANARMMLSPGLSALKVNAAIGSLSYSTESSTLDIPNANVNVKVSYKNGLWVGTSQLNIPEIVTNHDNRPELNIGNMLLQGNSDVSGNLLSTTITLGADKIQLGNVNYGPLSYDFNAKNIDANAWLKLRELTAQYDALMNANSWEYSLKVAHYHRGWFSSDAQIILSVNRAKPTGFVNRQIHNITRQSELLLIGNQIGSTLPAIVNKGAQFSLQPTPSHGEPQIIQVNASLLFPKVLQAQSLGQLIEKAETHVKVAFLADFVKAVAAHKYPEKNDDDLNTLTSSLLNKWLASGYLNQSNQQYVFALDYSQGKLSINGKVMADAAAGQVPNVTVTTPAGPVNLSTPAVPTTTVPATTTAPAATTTTSTAIAIPAATPAATSTTTAKP